jgi:hypothetical protein
MAILIAIIIVVILLAAAVGGRALSKRRLRASFGPEVETVARERGSRREVDRELRRRKKEHAALELRSISPQDRENYADSWEHVQAEFLDDPSLALTSAERLVSHVLEARGYPGSDAEEQLALLSVEYADSLAGFRTAQEVSRRAHEDEAIPTETLRRAMLSYLTLFNELLGAPSTAAATAGAGNDDGIDSNVTSRSTDGLEANT